MGTERVARHQIDDGDGGIQRMEAQRIMAAEVAPYHLGHHHQVASGRHQGRHRHEARQSDTQFPLHPEAPQPEIHHGLAVAPAGGVDVGPADQIVRPQRLGQRAAKRRQAHQGIAEPLLPPQPGGEMVGAGEPDHQIQLPLLQLPLVVAVRQLAHFQTAVGRQLHHALHQRRDQAVLHRPRGGDAKHPLGAGGIEVLGLPQPLLQHGQRLAYRSRQRLGPLGRHHLAPAHHEQGVIQRLAQASQGVADGGLGEVQPFGGTGDVALLHQHVEHGEQVEVEAGEGQFHRY